MSHARPALRRPEAGLALALAFATAVAVFVVIFLVGRSNTPDYTATLFGQADTDAARLKAQLATGVLGLAALQLVLALWMYGRLPGVRRVPGPVPLTHRIVGVVLFALSVPITVHCIQAYGVQLNGSRAAVHSIAGCFFYGAFAAKVLLVQAGACRAGPCRWPGARWWSWWWSSGTRVRCGTSTETACRCSRSDTTTCHQGRCEDRTSAEDQGTRGRTGRTRVITTLYGSEGGRWGPERTVRAAVIVGRFRP